jgi:anti-sigma B factor antagonist
MQEKGVFNLIINLKELDWISSAGLGALISSYTTMKKVGGIIYLSNLNNKIKNMLRLTKLDQVFLIFNDVDSAINSFLNIAN